MGRQPISYTSLAMAYNNISVERHDSPKWKNIPYPQTFKQALETSKEKTKSTELSPWPSSPIEI